MKSTKYAIAGRRIFLGIFLIVFFVFLDELKNTNPHCPFIWMKLTDAILVVPTFDRGILVDVLATGMPL